MRFCCCQSMTNDDAIDQWPMAQRLFDQHTRISLEWVVSTNKSKLVKGRPVGQTTKSLDRVHRGFVTGTS